MNVDRFERVFGGGRQQMATGAHVEVFREATTPGERRRYTKRFLTMGGADFRQWTDREWRILARLIGHGVRCVPAVVRYHAGMEGVRELQTYDAGVSVDQWATLLPVERDGRRLRHVFEDCAHWWALAHHCLAALEEIHALELVHLDVKADNLCIPHAPAEFDPFDPDARLHLDFERLALIDFAFSLVSRERLSTSLPIGWQREYDYQSPRLLRALQSGREGDLVPTQELDWRCDLYSLAAMLRRYLPDEDADDGAMSWTPARHAAARELIARLRDCHDSADASHRPHAELIALTAPHVRDPALAASIAAGWSLVRDPAYVDAATSTTPLTRIALAHRAPTRVTQVRTVVVAPGAPTVFRNPRTSLPPAPIPTTHVAPAAPPPAKRHSRRAAFAVAGLAAVVAAPFVMGMANPLVDAMRDGFAKLRVTNEDSPLPTAVAEAPRTDVAPAPVASPPPAVATVPHVSEPPREPVAMAEHAPAVRPVPRAVAPTKPSVVETRPPTAPAPAPNANRAFERALAQLQESPAKLAERTPYDAAAAQRATARLAMQATRVAPASVVKEAAPPAPKPVELASAPPPVESTPTPAPKQEREGVASRAEPPPVVAEPPRVVVAPVDPKRSAEPVVIARPAETESPRRERWQDRLRSLLGLKEQHAAPVEERPNSSASTPPTGMFDRFARASPPADTTIPAPARSVPRATPATPSWTAGDDLARGRRILAETVPAVAERASADATLPLGMMTVAGPSLGARAYADAAGGRWIAESSPTPSPTDLRRARELYEQARNAYAGGRSAEALELETRALAANPRDPDVAGFLAFLNLRTSPVRAETARQLALNALAFSGSRRATRYEDWQTFAIASALTGRSADATRAWLLVLGLSGDAHRMCRAALRAQATFGDAMRAPAEAVASRIRRDGRGDEAPECMSVTYASG